MRRMVDRSMGKMGNSVLKPFHFRTIDSNGWYGLVRFGTVF
jgi:hypothetical protein